MEISFVEEAAIALEVRIQRRISNGCAADGSSSAWTSSKVPCIRRLCIDILLLSKWLWYNNEKEMSSTTKVDKNIRHENACILRYDNYFFRIIFHGYLLLGPWLLLFELAEANWDTQYWEKCTEAKSHQLERRKGELSLGAASVTAAEEGRIINWRYEIKRLIDRICYYI